MKASHFFKPTFVCVCVYCEVQNSKTTHKKITSKLPYVSIPVFYIIFTKRTREQFCKTDLALLPESIIV